MEVGFVYAKQAPFGMLPGGQTVTLIELNNGNGMTAQILSLGAIVHRLMVPDRLGHAADVVLGQSTAQAIWERPYGVGMVVGRCANRISGGCYTDGDRVIRLEQNAPGMTLHSASGNWGRRLFDVRIPDARQPRVELTLTDEGWAGFPGRLSLCVTYSLQQNQTLRIDYDAQCTERTVINPTQHMFLNLSGQASGSIGDQVLQVEADSYLPAAASGVPTGEIRPLQGSALDARTPVAFSDILESGDPDIVLFGGLDHNYCLRTAGYARAASVSDPHSGRRVTVFTDMPGIQVYTFNGLPRALSGKDGAMYTSHCAFCLETQHYPNAVNTPAFPSPMMEAATPWHSATAYQFDLVPKEA